MVRSLYMYTIHRLVRQKHWVCIAEVGRYKYQVPKLNTCSLLSLHTEFDIGLSYTKACLKKSPIFLKGELGWDRQISKDSENLANSLPCNLSVYTISCQADKWNETHRNQPKTSLPGLEMFCWNMAHLFIHYVFSFEWTLLKRPYQHYACLLPSGPVSASLQRAGKQYVSTQAGKVW